MFSCFKMFTIFLKLTLVCFVVVLLTVQTNFAWQDALVNVEEKEQFKSSSKNSLTTTKIYEEQQQLNSPKEKENEDHKDLMNNTHSDDVKNKTKVANDSLEEYITEEPFVTEPMTTSTNTKAHAVETKTVIMEKVEENKGRLKRSKMMIGEVSEEEREYIKLELRRLTGLVEFLQHRQHSPVLDPPLDQLRTALDELMGDADELKSRQQGY